MASIPFAEEVAAAYYCAFDPKTPLRAKGILFAALAYFILPFDIVPDFILGVGFTDDMAVMAAAIGMIATHMTEEHRPRPARRWSASGSGGTGCRLHKYLLDVNVKFVHKSSGKNDGGRLMLQTGGPHGYQADLGHFRPRASIPAPSTASGAGRPLTPSSPSRPPMAFRPMASWGR